MTIRSVEEVELIRQAQQGSTLAFGCLVELHQVFVYNLALRALGDTQEAQDMSQEVFVRVWRSLPGFRFESQFRTWLYRIVMNLSYNRRPNLKRLLAEAKVDQVEEMTGQDQPGVEQGLIRQEHRQQLQQLIDELPQNYRLLILLRFQFELPYEEIGQILDLPLGTVKTGLHRARNQLKASWLACEEVEEWVQ